MRRLLLALILLGAFAFVFSVYPSPVVQAYDPFATACDGATDASICETSSVDPVTGENGIIMSAVRILSYIIGFVAIVMIIIGGLKFVTAGGNKESIASARSTIIYALIGLVVAATSQLLVRFIISIL